jgi:hypothetical protein
MTMMIPPGYRYVQDDAYLPTAATCSRDDVCQVTPADSLSDTHVCLDVSDRKFNMAITFKQQPIRQVMPVGQVET